MATQTYGSTNPLLQTPEPTPWNTPVQGPIQVPIQSTPAPAPALAPAPAPVASPVAPPEPTVGETLQGIKTQALTIQDQLNQANAGAGYKPVTLEQGMADPSTQAPIDESAIARNQMRLFQTEIDATNKVYDQLYNQKVLEGTGRLGSQRAQSARGGLLGSDFGSAAQDTMTNYNSEITNSVQAERQAKIGSIMGKVRSAVADDIAAKRLARTQDADALIAYHANRKQTRQTNIDMISHSLLQQGLDPSTMTSNELDAIGKEAGISAQDIITSYAQTKEAKASTDAETALKTKKTEAEISKINADIASGKLISLGEGSTLYNTETKETFKNPKTYAPVSSGGASSGGKYNSDLDAVVGAATLLIPSKFGQENFNKQINSARSNQDKLNIVASQVLRGQSADLRNDFSNLKTSASEIKKAIAAIDEGVATGYLKNGAQYTANVFGRDFDPKLAKIKSHITAATQPYRNSVTGAAWGGQEDTEYASLFGSTKYAPTELRQRLETMVGIIENKQASYLNSAVNPLDFYDNQFSTSYSSGGDMSHMSDAELEKLANGG